jgi:hypothetical protein
MYTLQNLPLHTQDESWGIKRRCHKHSVSWENPMNTTPRKNPSLDPHLNHNTRLPACPSTTLHTATVEEHHLRHVNHLGWSHDFSHMTTTENLKCALIRPTGMFSFKWSIGDAFILADLCQTTLHFNENNQLVFLQFKCSRKTLLSHQAAQLKHWC